MISVFVAWLSWFLVHSRPFNSMMQKIYWKMAASLMFIYKSIFNERKLIWIGKANAVWKDPWPNYSLDKASPMNEMKEEKLFLFVCLIFFCFHTDHALINKWILHKFSSCLCSYSGIGSLKLGINKLNEDVQILLLSLKKLRVCWEVWIICTFLFQK